MKSSCKKEKRPRDAFSSWTQTQKGVRSDEGTGSGTGERTREGSEKDNTMDEEEGGKREENESTASCCLPPWRGLSTVHQPLVPGVEGINTTNRIINTHGITNRVIQQYGYRKPVHVPPSAGKGSGDALPSLGPATPILIHHNFYTAPNSFSASYSCQNNEQ